MSTVSGTKKTSLSKDNTPIAVLAIDIGDNMTEATTISRHPKPSSSSKKSKDDNKPIIDFSLIQGQIKEDKKDNVSLADFDLDWEVKKYPMSYMDLVNGKPGYYSTPYFALVRDDMDEVLGSVTKTYEPIQNKQIFDFMESAFGEVGLSLVKGFPIHRGKKIVLMAEIDQTETIGKDVVKRYVYGLSSHDGSFALKFGFASKVMSCQNQFYSLAKGASLKLRHTKGAVVNRLDEFAGLVDIVLGQERNMLDTYKVLSETKNTPQITDKVIQMLTQTNSPLSPEGVAELSSRKQNIISMVRGAINHEISTKGDNLWGLFNGVTWYFNHVKYRNKPQEERVDNLVIGYGNVNSRKSLELIIKESGILLPALTLN